jgi:uncharacterized ion transporter superfamily protein YfcC
MDKRKLKRYEIAVYGLLLAFAVILGLIGDRISQDTIKAIIVNLSSELLAVGILFFIINRIFLLSDDNGLLNKLLYEVNNTIESSLNTELQLEKKTSRANNFSSIAEWF